MLATNVAETSLTVPGIRYVIDPGLARISRWSPRTKVQRLPIEPISQASAQPALGPLRAGRRRASRSGSTARRTSGAARVHRAGDPAHSLASVILQMTSLGSATGRRGSRSSIRPTGERCATAYSCWRSSARWSAGRRRPTGPRLTGVGRKLARLPIDPRLARMILEADRLGCLREVLVIAAALSIQDPRERPVEQRARADQLHARFADPRSDFLAWLNLWRYLRDQQRELGSGAVPADVPRGAPELPAHARVAGRRVPAAPGGQAGGPRSRARRRTGSPTPTASTRRCWPGCSRTSGCATADRRDYLGARGARFAIFPGSGLSKSQPDWVMAAELVETSRLWGRQNAADRPEWAERLGGDLVKRTYSEPHWSKKRASAHGLREGDAVRRADRRRSPRPLGQHQPDVARELFIRHALVQGEWRTQHRFFETNRRLLEEAEELEHRARRHDIVVDEETLFDFYDERVPADVVSGAHFDTWWKQERRTRPDLLTFDPAMLVHDRATRCDADDFPDEWREGAAALPLRYHFEPGHEADGVTVDVPLATLNTVGAAPFTWNVPGLRHELVTALIRSLPKQLRVNFVPAPDVARRFLEAVPPGEEPLSRALSRYLRSLTGVHVPEESWDLDEGARTTCGRPSGSLDEQGAEVGVGKDLEALKQPLRPSFDRAMRQVADESGVTATGQTDVDVRHDRAVVHPDARGPRGARLPDAGRRGQPRVGLRVAASPDEQEAHHRLGVRRLLLLAVPSPVGALVEGLDNAAKLGLAASPYPNVRALSRTA